MKTEIELKLGHINDLWINYILEYKFCNTQIKFTAEVQTNYLGDILGYFEDTLKVAFEKRNAKSYPSIFSYYISLLQAIYIHQDFIEELLGVFECQIDKNKLYKDRNYSINRDLRNELVGHPYRKKGGKTISSTTFGYQSDTKTLQYLCYHRDKNFNFELKTFSVLDIQLRHQEFLNTYLDIVINKLHSIIKIYGKELRKIKLKKNDDFADIIKVASDMFESIFDSDYLYNTKSLNKVYAKRSQHRRYQNLIDSFISDLKNGLQERQNDINEELKFKPKQKRYKRVNVNITFVKAGQSSAKPIKRNFGYELGKLGSKRGAFEFEFFSSPLRKRYSRNNAVIAELSNMESNQSSDTEYYCSYKLLRKLVGRDS